MTPEFAVVGHPNKGKSSIVSTIAQNDERSCVRSKHNVTN